MYRLVDCGTWDDPWFESLAPQGKLLFLYLLTNPRSTSCGAFEITPRKMAFETGLSQDFIEKMLRSWAPRVQWWPEHQIVFLKNFYRRQSNSAKVRVNAAKLVADMPSVVREAIYMEYPEFLPGEDTLSIPYGDGIDKQNVTETETETEQDGDETPPLPPRGNGHASYTADFESFWSEYPRVVNNSKLKAFNAWRKLSDEDRAAARAALPRFNASDGWRRGFATHTATFLNGKLWESDPPDAPPRAGPASKSGGYFAAGQSIDEKREHERQRDRHGVGDDYRALLADTEDGRAQRGVDGPHLAEGAGGYSVAAAHRTRPG